MSYKGNATSESTMQRCLADSRREPRDNRTNGFWHVHVPPFYRRASWATHGPGGAAIEAVRISWRLWLLERGYEDTECPVEGLMAADPALADEQGEAGEE